MTNAKLKVVIAFKKSKLNCAVPRIKKSLIERYYSTYQRFDLMLQEAITEAGMVETKALVKDNVDRDAKNHTVDPLEIL